MESWGRMNNLVTMKEVDEVVQPETKQHKTGARVTRDQGKHT